LLSVAGVVADLGDVDARERARKLLKEVATVRSMDVVLPVKGTENQETREVRLRIVARPDRMVAELLARLGVELPSIPKALHNVVEKNRA
jgi:hypothetical protein